MRVTKYAIDTRRALRGLEAGVRVPVVPPGQRMLREVGVR